MCRGSGSEGSSFPIQYYSELWNLTVLVLIHRTQYSVSCVKTYSCKGSSQTKRKQKGKFDSIKNV